MADDIENITFQNDAITDSSGHTARLNGTIQVDYTTRSYSGNYTVTENDPGNQLSASGTLSNSGGLAANNGQFTLTDGSLTVTYSGEKPTTAVSESYVIAPTVIAGVGTFGGDTYSGTGEPLSAVCFTSGTLIRTSLGDVPVEEVAVGAYVATHSDQMLASAALVAIRWVGHRTIDCARHPRPHEIMPIRISAHAFAENRPSRDLCVSPGHAICVDAAGEVLIPAAALVNGTTIVQEQVANVTYWHVELDGGHNILFAENLPCESYIEMGNRSFFAETEATALHASPDTQVVTHADFCRPFHQNGSVVAFVRERLAARSPNLGWALKEEPFANLHLLVDGQRLQAETNGLTARFLLPASAKEVWLISDTSVPAEVGLSPDLRPLGVCIGSLVIDDGFGSPRAILADHPHLSVGFHDVEEGPQRWTAGRARLPAEIWESCHGSFFLRVELTRSALPRWVGTAPARSAAPSKALAA